MESRGVVKKRIYLDILHSVHCCFIEIETFKIEKLEKLEMQ